MSAPRKFDHAEARRLRTTGLTYVQVAALLGVSVSAVRLACDDDARREAARAKRDWAVANHATVRASDRAYRKRVRAERAGCLA